MSNLVNAPTSGTQKDLEKLRWTAAMPHHLTTILLTPTGGYVDAQQTMRNNFYFFDIIYKHLRGQYYPKEGGFINPHTLSPKKI